MLLSEQSFVGALARGRTAVSRFHDLGITRCLSKQAAWSTRPQRNPRDGGFLVWGNRAHGCSTPRSQHATTKDPVNVLSCELYFRVTTTRIAVYWICSRRWLIAG